MVVDPATLVSDAGRWIEALSSYILSFASPSSWIVVAMVVFSSWARRGLVTLRCLLLSSSYVAVSPSILRSFPEPGLGRPCLRYDSLRCRRPASTGFHRLLFLPSRRRSFLSLPFLSHDESPPLLSTNTTVHPYHCWYCERRLLSRWRLGHASLAGVAYSTGRARSWRYWAKPCRGDSTSYWSQRRGLSGDADTWFGLDVRCVSSWNWCLERGRSRVVLSLLAVCGSQTYDS
jgi:hypothetical protein